MIATLATVETIKPGDIIAWRNGVRAVVCTTKIVSKKSRVYLALELYFYGFVAAGYTQRYRFPLHWHGALLGQVPVSLDEYGTVLNRDALNAALRATIPEQPTPGVRELSYFAIDDPFDQKVSFWAENRRWKRYPPIDRFRPWPSKAKHTGPPMEMFASEEKPLLAYAQGQWSYNRKVEELIDADRFLAASRFARLACACAYCGKALIDEQSKTYGVGPECRRGFPPELLAQFAAHMRKFYSRSPDESPEPE